MFCIQLKSTPEISQYSTFYRIGAGGLNHTTATQPLDYNGQLHHSLTGALLYVVAAVIKNAHP